MYIAFKVKQEGSDMSVFIDPDEADSKNPFVTLPKGLYLTYKNGQKELYTEYQSGDERPHPAEDGIPYTLSRFTNVVWYQVLDIGD